MSNILSDGKGNIAIINGGNPIGDCPTDWDEAKAWETLVNSGRIEEDEPTWSWDCGFKLDFDGPVLSICSRFYPPKTHYGPKWDGAVSVYVLSEEVEEKTFECSSLDGLKDEVEDYVNQLKERVRSLFK